MSLESELSKLRHPSNSKNFPILGSVPFEEPPAPFKFPMTQFLASDPNMFANAGSGIRSEYADDNIANEIPAYYPQIASVIFNEDTFYGKSRQLQEFAFHYGIPQHEYDFFHKLIARLNDQKIAEAGLGRADGPKLPVNGVNNTTNVGSIYAGTGDTLDTGETLVGKARKVVSNFFRLS